MNSAYFRQQGHIYVHILIYIEIYMYINNIYVISVLRSVHGTDKRQPLGPIPSAGCTALPSGVSLLWRLFTMPRPV